LHPFLKVLLTPLPFLPVGREGPYFSFFLNKPLKNPFVCCDVSFVRSTASFAVSARSFHFSSRSLLIPAVCLIPSSKLCHKFLKNVCSGTRRWFTLPM